MYAIPHHPGSMKPFAHRADERIAYRVRECDARDYNTMRSLFSTHPRDQRGGDQFRTPAQLLRERMESEETAAAETANDW